MQLMQNIIAFYVFPTPFCMHDSHVICFYCQTAATQQQLEV